RSAGPFGFGQYRVDALLGADEVGERDTGKAAALRGDGGVGGERISREQPQHGHAVVEAEGHPLAIVLLDGPAEALAVELLRPVHVLDPERDTADVRVHCHTSLVTSTAFRTSLP